MMASKTVEFGVVTYGNNETRNYLNQTQNGYEGVVENVEMGRPTVTDLETIKNIKHSTVKGDIIDGIVAGQDVLIRVNAKNKFNRIMLIVTDGETEVEGLEDLETIVGQMKTIANFGLYVAMLGKVDETSTVVKKENQKLLASIAENTGGRFMEIEDIGDSVHLLSTGLGLGTKPQASKSVLQLSESLQIPVVFWGRVMKAVVPSLKKRARGAKAARLAAGEEDEAAAAVKRDTTYRNPEDPDQELGVEEKVKGYKYGSQYVPITPADEAMFKVEGSAGIKVLGFVPAASVPRHHYMELPMILQGPAEADSALLAIGALAHAMRTTGLVALARFVKRENGDPFLAVLMPTEDEDSHCLLVHRLPCVEDVREYSYPSLIAFASDKLVKKDPLLSRQSASMSAFIDSLTVRDVGSRELTPMNFTLMEVYTEVYRRLTNIPANQTIHGQDPLGRTPSSVSAAGQLALREVRAAFELVKQETTSAGKRKVYWSELDLSADKDGQPVAPRFQLNLAAGAEHVAQLAAAAAASQVKEAPAPIEIPQFTVGSVTAVEDFEAVLSAAPLCGAGAAEIIRQAMNTMMDVIDRNVTFGASNAHYKRAIGCIQALRGPAVREGEWQAFNTFLNDRVKTRYLTGRHRAVWNLLVEENITLISSGEDTGSNVSEAEARDFLREETAAAPTAVAAAVEEEEDMFGNME